MGTPRQASTTSRTAPAIRVLAAIKVTGGIVSIPILMNVYEAPQTLARTRSRAYSVHGTEASARDFERSDMRDPRWPQPCRALAPLSHAIATALAEACVLAIRIAVAFNRP